MMMIQLGVDVVEELKLVLPSYYELIVPSIVINELTTLKKKAKGKDKIASNIALQLAQSDNFSIVNIEKTDHVDNLLPVHTGCGYNSVQMIKTFEKEQEKEESQLYT